jgi:hypothetical protein
MANALLGNVYKYRVFCYSGDQTGLNTKYFQVSAVTGTPQSELLLAQALDSVMAPLYKPALFNGAQYIGSDIQNITSPPPYPVQLGTNANTGIGTGGGVPMASQVSGIYTTRTGLTGRAYRGRSYVPFPPAAASTIGPPPLMGAGYIATLTAIADEMTGTTMLNVGGTFYYLAWMIRHKGPTPPAGTLTPTTVSVVGSSWATQRRRGDYGRTNPVPNP